MKICHHIIAKDQIVGIGPLLLKLSPDNVMRSLYNECQLFFFLHLKNHTAKIESDWFKVGADPDRLSESESKDRMSYRDFSNNYYSARLAICELLGEEIESYKQPINEKLCSETAQESSR